VFFAFLYVINPQANGFVPPQPTRQQQRKKCAVPLIAHRRQKPGSLKTISRGVKSRESLRASQLFTPHPAAIPTFVDNHDNHARIRFIPSDGVPIFDNQVTAGLACLLALPEFHCIYS
jgi:hypothetical protein